MIRAVSSRRASTIPSALALSLLVPLAACGDESPKMCSATTTGTGVPVELGIFDHVGIGSDNGSGWENTNQALHEFDWGQGPFQKLTLAFDLASSCSPFESWVNDPPPEGQNWPVHCDAFDRNLDVFVEESLEDPLQDGLQDSLEGPPIVLDDPWKHPEGAGSPFNVIHAITPFGGPEHIEVDLTDLANAAPGKHNLRVRLVSFSDADGTVTGSNAGWTVSAKIVATTGQAPRRVLAAVPLFAKNVVRGDTPPTVTWDVPQGARSGKIEYRASGHGGGALDARCNGPADEFCDRRHLISIDGVQVDNIDAYRTDCALLCTLSHYGPADKGFDYCAENPCGDVRSVRASRANWCPGSMTPPYVWSALDVFAQPGPHVFSAEVLNVGDGGNWMLSAIYYAYAEDIAAGTGGSQ